MLSFGPWTLLLKSHVLFYLSFFYFSLCSSYLHPSIYLSIYHFYIYICMCLPVYGYECMCVCFSLVFPYILFDCNFLKLQHLEFNRAFHNFNILFFSVFMEACTSHSPLPILPPPHNHHFVLCIYRSVSAWFICVLGSDTKELITQSISILTSLWTSVPTE